MTVRWEPSLGCLVTSQLDYRGKLLGRRRRGGKKLKNERKFPDNENGVSLGNLDSRAKDYRPGL